MADPRQVGQGIRRRMGAESSTLEMAGPKKRRNLLTDPEQTPTGRRRAARADRASQRAVSDAMGRDANTYGGPKALADHLRSQPWWRGR